MRTNPDEVLTDTLKLAREVQESEGTDLETAGELAAHVLQLDEWLVAEGRIPSRWPNRA